VLILGFGLAVMVDVNAIWIMEAEE